MQPCLLALSIVVLTSGPLYSSADLPTDDCVQALRSASIERLRGDSLAQLTKLRAATDPCKEGISAILALLRFHQRTPLPEEEYSALSAALVERTESPEFRLSLGVAEQLIGHSETDEEILHRVIRLLQRRLVDEEATTRVKKRVLRTIADAQHKLGVKDYGATLERLHALDPEADDVTWTLFGFYRKDENWEKAIEVLEELVRRNHHLRVAYVLMLAKAGRREQLMTELDQLANEAIDKTVVAVPSAEDPAGLMGGAGMFASIATGIAWQLRADGYDADAEKVFRRIIEVLPTHPVASAALLQLYGTAEERAAHQTSLVAQRSAETDPTALLNQSADLLAARDYQAAYEVLLRLVNQFADSEVLEAEAAWYNFGIAAYRTKHWQQADVGFTKALEFNPRTQSVFFLGMAKVKLERYAQAIPLLEKSLAQDANRKATHYQLWRCYAALGKETEAAKHQAAYRALP